MKVISPVAFTDAILTSSSIAEPDTGETAWVSAGTYALNDLRIRATTHRIYKCIQASTGRTALPEVDTAYWSDNGPTNRWAPFDASVSTVASATTSLSYVFKPGNVNSIGLFGLQGTSLTITQKDAPGGSVVYTSTTSLDGTLISDWYMYFFEPASLLDTMVLTNALVPYLNCEVTVTLTGTGTVKMGVLAVGTAYDLGPTQYNATAGIIDYSTKTVDVNGNVVITKRAYSRRLDLSTWIDTAQFNKIYSLLATLRSTPVVWAGTDSASYLPLNVYGYYKDFTLHIAYPSTNLCTLQIEGLT